MKFCYAAQKRLLKRLEHHLKRVHPSSSLGEKTEITKDDVKTIQDEEDVLIEVPNAATKKESKEVVIDIKKGIQCSGKGLRCF